MSLRIALAAAAVALSAGLAHAAVLATQPMTVQAIVNPTCALSGVGTYDFGAIGGTVSPFTQANGQFLVNCSAGLAYSVQISTSFGNATGTRRMSTTGGQTMDYVLEYLDPITGAPTTWTSTTFPSRTGNGSFQSVTFRGTIPTQTPSGGAWVLNSQFTDTVTITVEG